MPFRSALLFEIGSFACSLFVLTACGAAPKPAAADPSDTALLEQRATPSSATPAAPATAADAQPPAPAASPGAGDAAATQSLGRHAAPAATGSIDGKPFTPKFAQLAGPLKKNGDVLVVLHEGDDCQAPADTKAGGASMLLIVPWREGYKVDLSALRRAKKHDLGEAAFVRIGPDKKKEVSPTFRPSGLLTVVAAPTQRGAVGDIKIDLQSGDYMLVGELDVKVCAPTK